MSIAIAFEGCDGSGKTTLIGLVSELLKAEGVAVEVVGKSDIPETALITKLIQSPDLAYGASAEATLKIARELQRLDIAANSTLTLLDRGLVSITSVLRASEIDVTPYAPLLEKCFAAVDLYATVLCDTPFDAAWARMQERVAATGAALSKKELRGPEFNRQVYQAMYDSCETGAFSGPVHRVDTWSADPASSAAEIASWILGTLESRKIETAGSIPV